MELMELWEQVCTTDPAITKKVTQRGGFTAICAQAQLKRATELWGPYGKAWGVHKLVWGKFGTEAEFDVTLDAVFYCPAAEFEISACDKWKIGNDTRKKLLTDLTTKALSKLGFNSDVFEGKFDDNKYVEAQKKASANPTHQGTQSGSKQQSGSTTGNIPPKDSDFETALAGFKGSMGAEKFDRILGDTGFAGIPWGEIPNDKHGWIRHTLKKATEG